MWLNVSIATLNAMLQLLVIYRFVFYNTKKSYFVELLCASHKLLISIIKYYL